jgi:hypothetical protein
MIVFDSDDFGANHIISDMCQAHDCRDVLDALHNANLKFKATLFTIPGEMTPEMYNWCAANSSWIELAWHGFFHTSNYECEKMTYEEFDYYINGFSSVGFSYQNIFKAPGWQISPAIYEWLHDHDWIVADQPFNAEKRPKGLKVYEVGENSIHTHTWNCVGNGVYELFDELMAKVKAEKEFKFVSEVVNGD